ncbi:uncharacterized protein LOC141907478 [Tubulanus polymorphus]|uniref:uncharacterized protein LOC141907478 n=1 Tax=Tubulanus polymorphus TaxID=672921 RepID=UPI003DA52C95
MDRYKMRRTLIWLCLLCYGFMPAMAKVHINASDANPTVGDTLKIQCSTSDFLSKPLLLRHKLPGDRYPKSIAENCQVFRSRFRKIRKELCDWRSGEFRVAITDIREEVSGIWYCYANNSIDQMSISVKTPLPTKVSVEDEKDLSLSAKSYERGFKIVSRESIIVLLAVTACLAIILGVTCVVFAIRGRKHSRSKTALSVDRQSSRSSNKPLVSNVYVESTLKQSDTEYADPIDLLDDTITSKHQKGMKCIVDIPCQDQDETADATYMKMSSCQEERVKLPAKNCELPSLPKSEITYANI